MKWITRERPKIDRIACPWLIARFIDDTPEFLFVQAPEVVSQATQTGAIPYDIPGVELSHVGELCSFDAFLKKYQLTDPALQQLAVIVRGAGINIVAIHNHMINETPRYVFLHYWGVGATTDLAKALKAALDTQSMQ